MSAYSDATGLGGRGGREYDEAGAELLANLRQEGHWRAVWRRQLPAAAAAEEDGSD